ncbi:MAG: M14 family zinc carboxypeptidase [Flavobacteriaceae bacterium]
MKILSSLLLMLILFSCNAQARESDLTEILYTTYEDHKENSLEKRRIKYADLQPLIEQYASNPKFQVNKVGESIEGRDLNLISIGNGSIDVFLWSQMHGNEPTATQAIFDILNFLDSKFNVQEKREIFGKLRIHFLPMLNPDGAEVFQRRNTLGIDINRDALRLQSPEGMALKRVRDSLEADFGFNLHDQSIYYNAELTPKPATISYLAPAYNYEKDINDVRGNAMKVIGFMNDIIQKYAPGQVGRYNDDFEPRAFGDNIQKWGTSTILIESGGFADDIEKQEIRKLNYVSILSAIYTIARGNYNSISLDTYWAIPENDRKLFDLKLEEVGYNLLGKDYILDLGIHLQEVDDEIHSDFWYKARISDQGDLSTYYGYKTLNAKGYMVREGKVYDQVLESLEDLNDASALNLLDEGYVYVRVRNLPKDQVFSPYPVHVISENYKLPELKLAVGQNPTFFLEYDGELKYVVMNGFLIDLETGPGSVRMNGLLLR